MLIRIKFIVFTGLICLSSISSFSQVKISGRVFNAKDSSAIYGASIYLDGTSIGTATNNSGKFDLNMNKDFQATMIISSMGYEQIKLTDPSKFSGKLLKVYLREKQESLETVFLEADPWSREKKLKIFKEQFIGMGKTAKNCKILNEDEIILRYSPSKNTLLASSENKLVIENNNLGYKINYTLVDFNVQFKPDENESSSPVSIYYSGTSYFENLTDKIPKRILRKRKQAYLGSSLHFMRSINKKSLDKQKFDLYKGHNTVSQENILRLDVLKNYTHAKPLVKSIRIRYDQNHWSTMNFEDDFIIDTYGNFSPPNSITFSGEMSQSRISQMVPLNYQLK
ncbi:carboxypeptidase-like regulatory domain-containing protein [Christiangramia sediminis]|uniref:Carboxypeptidase-like regulatory domain-containing protein n=1 Tax=Christiangramia sediminis TaxID=2881336 RepID=A0A9X1LJ88_9FLAO|nr:carboxypeptidase-like regulatory domain-containing protein [Christiangramia sediminis]MCB7481405.1 carboxypeptidase-like regulatory domain-containing protein [Christiangramia sediminis]